MNINVKKININKLWQWCPLPQLTMGTIAMIILFFTFGGYVYAGTIGKPSNFLSVNTNLVGWWTFDGKDMVSNVADRSGQGNTGYLKGQTATTTIQGKIGQGLRFDGIDDYVNLGIDSSLTPADITISAWVKVNQLSSWSGIISNMTSWGTGFGLQIGTTQNIAVTLSGTYLKTSWTPQIGKWYHVVATHDSSNNYNVLYVNGSYENSTTQSVSYEENVKTYIGVFYTSPSLFLNGTLDDIRIYNRALSASEIRQLYNLGSASKISASPKVTPGEGLNSGLVGYWTFDGKNMVSNVADSSGQNNKGYIKGQTSTTTVMGKIGQGLRFDGSDDYVVTSVGSESLYDFERTSPFSISFWLKPVHTDTSNQIPISKSSDQDSNYSGFHWVNNLSCNYSANAPGSIAFAFVNAWGSNYLCVFSAGTLINQKSQWIHYAVTYSGSAQASGIKMYQNGVALSLTTGSIPNGNTLTSSSLNNYPVSFGARSDGSSSWHENYNGSMDDVRIYNRELSITEIQQLYNLGR